ncbi:unnamed protein product [Blepharisma stoltei]|uniref:Receptor ligand binding region domain-containing protein n=1 Tax=Blepharisma stoltei TaxID=1481888 RepID=A0AAU9J024_9CILI|nr:unnamed protein product [Blepharisma stoltei]
MSQILISLSILILYAWFTHSASSVELMVVQDNTGSKNSLWNFLSMKNFFYSSNDLIDWYNCSISEIPKCIEKKPNTSVILNLFDDLSIQFEVSQLCKEYKIIHLVLQDEFVYRDEWTYSAISSQYNRLDAFFSLLKHYSWDKGVIFTNNFDQDIFTNFTSDFKVLTIENKTDIDNLIKRIVVPMGSSLYYIFASSDESNSIQNNLAGANLLTSGNGLILNQQGGYNCSVEGALIIVDMGQEDTCCEEDYFANSVINFLSYLAINAENSSEIKLLLEKKLKTHYSENKFSLLNIQNGQRVIIGSIIDGNIKFYNDTIFPGKTKTVPKSTKKIINISIGDGSANPNSPPSTVGTIGARGSYVAQKFINEGLLGILLNFQVNLFSFDCGTTVYNEAFAKACFTKDYNNIGLAYLSPFGSSPTVGTLRLFKKMNWTIPVIGSTNSEATLNSTAIYPMYTRVWPSSSFSYSLQPVLLRALGWKSAAIMYQNDSWGQTGYFYATQGAENHNLDLINPIETRVLPATLDRAGIQNYTKVIQGVIDSQARLIIFIFQSPLCNYVLETFYDLGMRKGDIIVFTPLADFLSDFAKSDNYTYKRLELGSPMITFFGQQWVGSIGQTALSRMLQLYNNSSPSAYAAYWFDGLFSAAYAVDYMINRGRDYTDPLKLESTIRSVQFVGCTGTVTIEKDSNDRILSKFDVQTNKFDVNGNLVKYIIGALRPLSTHILQITNPIIYSDGTTIKPADLRNQDNPCPFPDDSVKTFMKGKILVFGICFSIAFISIIITIYIWKRWWNAQIDELKDKQEVSFPDVIIGATIVIEFFQYSSMGPNFSMISPFLAEISNPFGLELQNIIKLKNGVFWVVVDIVFGSIVIWITMCMVILFRLDEKYARVSPFRLIAWLADYLMPILGNLCFIPFISICLDIFVCDESIGDSFTDSFLAKDCYYFCWKDEHLVYAIISFIALVCYCPLAVFCRPLWQELQHLLHVKTTPLFLMVKTIVQLILIVLNKTLKRATGLGHGIVFTVAMVCYVAFIYKFKPYNYPRFSWWQILVMIGVAWLAFLSTVCIGLGYGSLIFLIVLIFGWVLIACIGVYVQKRKYPSMLYRKKGQTVTDLFKFTFGKNSTFTLKKIVPNYEKGSSELS